jgi:sugar phosphate isomerase/epimerase
MKLGFVSAILPELSLEDVLKTAADLGYSCVELMCWPVGKAERRYAGVTHVDVASVGAAEVRRILDLLDQYGVSVSGLGYYPNPLTPDEAEARASVDQIRRVIDAAQSLGIGVVNTFVGRDPGKSIDDQWSRFLETWRPIVSHAEQAGIRIGIENCPMSFGQDEWPGGKNLAVSPAVWRRMYADIPSSHWGLNFDPSHFVLQMMDYVPALHEFKDRLVHVHAKDVRIDRAKLNDHGVFAFPKLWHSPKLPGMGDVDWGMFLGTLADTGYSGPLVVEVEDRAFEGSLARRIESLAISRRYLSQFVGGG